MPGRILSVQSCRCDASRALQEPLRIETVSLADHKARNLFYFRDAHAACPKGFSATSLARHTLIATVPQRSYCKEGATFQRPCPSRFYGNHSGLGTATCSGPCPAGRACVAQTIQPVPCALGTYAPAGQDSCKGCPKGWHAAREASSACMRCLPGRVAADRAAECKKCTPGLYSNVERTECLSCPPGFFASDDGATNCTRCAAGFETKTDGSRTCTKVEPSKNVTFKSVKWIEPLAKIGLEWIERPPLHKVHQDARKFTGHDCRQCDFARAKMKSERPHQQSALWPQVLLHDHRGECGGKERGLCHQRFRKDSLSFTGMLRG